MRRYKRFVGPAQLGTTPTTLYTVPAGARSLIRNIYANNPSASANSITLSIGADEDATHIFDADEVPANDILFARRKTNYVLEAGEVLSGYAGTASAPGILDDFNRANEDPLTTNWNGPIHPAIGQLRVVSNQLLPNASVNGGNWWDAATFGPDCEAYVTLATKPDNGDHVLVYARLQDAGTTSLDGYFIQFIPVAGTNDDEFYLWTMTDGAGVEVLDFHGSFEWAAGDKMMIRCIGSQIEGWYCPVSTGIWAKLLEATDSTYTGAGHIGLNASPGATVLDDFGGGTSGSSIVLVVDGVEEGL